MYCAAVDIALVPGWYVRVVIVHSLSLSLSLSVSVRLGPAQAIRQLLLFDVRRYFLLEHRAAACWSGAARTGARAACGGWVVVLGGLSGLVWSCLERRRCALTCELVVSYRTPPHSLTHSLTESLSLAVACVCLSNDQKRKPWGRGDTSPRIWSATQK